MTFTLDTEALSPMIDRTRWLGGNQIFPWRAVIEFSLCFSNEEAAIRDIPNKSYHHKVLEI